MVIIPSLYLTYTILQTHAHKKSCFVKDQTIMPRPKNENMLAGKVTGNPNTRPVTPNILFSLGLNLMMSPVNQNNLQEYKTTLTF